MNPKVPEKGERYMGTVVKTTSFGAFITLVPGCDGLLHTLHDPTFSRWSSCK